MKLSLNTDFTSLPRAGSHIRRVDLPADRPTPFDVAVLPHDERHLRRRVIGLAHGGKVMVELPKPAMLESGDVLVFDDGRHAEIVAADEELYDIRAKNPVHLAELAWHIGNRHLAVEVEEDRILILREPAIAEMLEELGATVTEVAEPFHPVREAEGHSHEHRHDHGHDHGHSHHHHDHDD